MRLGVHLQTGEGYESAARYAASIGCECAQVFAKSPRMWSGRPADPARSAAFAQALRDGGVWPLFTHTAYLINPATEAEPLRTRSVEALADELSRAALLGAAGVVTHLGSTDAPMAAAAASIARAVLAARRLAPAAEGVRLLLEGSAGQGASFGATFAELGALLEHLDRDGGGPAGVCIDTCHSHAAGIDLSCEAGWESAMGELARTCGAGALGLVHANDSALPCGSRRDRHAWVGDGTIGERGFRAMMHRPELRGIPMVVEASGERPVKDLENLARLRRLRDDRG